MIPRVLILGGSSPLGLAIRSRLSRTAAEITWTSRHADGERLDVRDELSLSSLIDAVHPESVIYLASPPVAELERDGVAETMNDALAHAAACAARAGARRFIFASSAAVYGTATRAARREDAETVGTHNYARFKIDGEQILKRTATRQMAVTSLRYFNLYGPGFARSLINRLADPAERPELRIDSEFVRDYVHGDDAAAATLAALARPAHGGYDVLNVGTGAPTSNTDLASLVSPESYIATSAGAPSSSVADPSRAREALGFAPSIDVRAALAEPAHHILGQR